MHLDINSIGYGNITQEQLIRSREKMFLINLPQLPICPPPLNSSHHALGELQYLASIQKEYEGSSFIDFVNRADSDLRSIYIGMMGRYGINFGSYYDNLFDELSTLVIRLKVTYNRIRPFQLAGILGFPLYPMSSESAYSPSYPSGHTLQSYVVSEVISKQYPFMSDVAREIANSISLSREIGGWHFPSDNKFSIEIGKAILPYIVRPSSER